ncbi:MAG TPA: LacI family DNA-binding transcriptional regulator [Algoriphagus sp.]|nr:LacI family DNA-binding transcriptional regulator [Algoriphagus sp.]
MFCKKTIGCYVALTLTRIYGSAKHISNTILMSIKKIAEMAGVSIGTVDRVLHGRGRVSEETKEKIEKIALQINYKPNLMASSLSKKRKATVVILMPDPAEDEYWQQAWTGIERLLPNAEKQGLDIKNYFYSLDNQKLFNKYAKQIIREKPDGLILAPNHPESCSNLLNECAKVAIPAILFDNQLPGFNPLAFIGTDLRQSGILCAQLLEMITHNPGSFALFHIDPPNSKAHDMIEKELGFKEFMESSHSKRLIRNFSIDSQQDLENQLDAAFENDIAACLVSNSKTWIVGEYLKKRNLSDVKLIGFDLISKNIELLKQGWINFLINQNPERQARKSLNRFINHFAFGETIQEKEYLPIEIITKGNLI